ncbi:MAG: D-lyxose/D-mannose family sugar isomerase [Clostridia bacterium]|nr:D-lyxose/D-mannose family sugar isomerase [Clostridia bacterium]
MKRSEINAAITRAMAALQKENITLPAFASYTAEDWKKLGARCENAVSVMLGWDVTDFNSGDFLHKGCTLFTVRNGSKSGIGTPYAEKYLIFSDTPPQEIPLHFHFEKTEDIINRAGGVMCIELYNSTADGEIDYKNDVTFYTDGIKNVLPAGSVIEITTGNSITLTPGLYHRIFVKEGTGILIAGEVSSINDDTCDNRFATPTKRFCGIEEDEPIQYFLANEYDKI